MSIVNYLTNCYTKIGHNKPQLPLYIGVSFLLFLVALELLIIHYLNNGFFVYTLDDPYIHLALAENIRNGHYGINLNEFSSPSSSILWPFILSLFPFFEYSPFLINLVASLAVVSIFVKILNILFNSENNKINNLLISVIVIQLILATNIVGLLFTGMEHSFQVLLVLIVAYGLLLIIEKGELKWWLIFAIILAPLVRYENTSISFVAISFLMIRGYRKQAFFSLVAISFLVGGFVVFLTSLGLDIFPTSVTAKSSLVQSGGALNSLSLNLMKTLVDRQGVILSFGALILLSYFIFGEDKSRRQIAFLTMLALFAHFIAGGYGWYNRYEIYIWSFMLVEVMYVFTPIIRNYLASIKKKSTTISAIVVFSGFIIISTAPYIYGLVTLPIASNNIYQQQYQMHRFVVDFYKMPVAVNDIGYVAYKNENFVLDLWGLGSEKVLQLRLGNNGSYWMKEISDESSIGLVMIYENWFQSIPKEWIKIGDLHLGKERITPASSKVSFFATNEKVKPDLEKNLHLFIKTLPVGVSFVFAKSYR